MIWGSRAKARPHTRLPRHKTPIEAEQSQVILELYDYGLKWNSQFQKTMPDKQASHKR